MNQLVSDDVVSLCQGNTIGQDDSPFKRLGNSACSLTHSFRNDCCLLELRPTGVDNKRLTPFKLMIKYPAVTGIPAFSHLSCLFDDLGFLLIKIDIKMLGLHNFKIEFLVLDLIPAKILGPQPRSQSENHQDGKQQRDHCPFIFKRKHPCLLVHIRCPFLPLL